MKLSLVVRGQYPPGDMAQHLHDESNWCDAPTVLASMAS